jgi:dTDP-4-dehydrorhamnose reductase
VGSDPVVLVTGGGGQVGRALRRELPSARSLSRAELDVTDRGAVIEAAKGVDVIVHLAALTDVDACERDPKVADSVNAVGTRNVVVAAEDVGARIVYLSTNHVFDGTKEGEYVEDDPPRPVNAYGRSKLAGEDELPSRGLVVRTSWVFGGGGERNFVRKVLEAASRDGDVPVVDDQMGRPTWSRDLASALAQLAREGTTGLLHVAGDGEPGTWADLAEATFAAAGVTANVRRVDTATYVRMSSDRVAPRPSNGVLSLDRARRAGVGLSDWRTSLVRHVENLS